MYKILCDFCGEAIPTDTHLRIEVRDVVKLGGAAYDACRDCWRTIRDRLNAKDNPLPEVDRALTRCIIALSANGAPNCEAAKEARASLTKLRRWMSNYHGDAD